MRFDATLILYVDLLMYPRDCSTLTGTTGLSHPACIVTKLARTLRRSQRFAFSILQTNLGCSHPLSLCFRARCFERSRTRLQDRNGHVVLLKLFRCAGGLLGDDASCRLDAGLADDEC